MVVCNYVAQATLKRWGVRNEEWIYIYRYGTDPVDSIEIESTYPLIQKRNYYLQRAKVSLYGSGSNGATSVKLYFSRMTRRATPLPRLSGPAYKRQNLG